MPQCELCGEDVPSLVTARVEGAELQVCESCANLGTEVKQEPSTTSTKYSTSDSGSTSSAGSSTSTSGSSTSGGSSRRRDIFDEMEELAPDYGDRIRAARESRDLSQADLAKQLSEKASLIRKLERGDILPSDQVQRKLERHLEISLTEEASADESEWSSDAAGQGLTLGDMVKRED